MIDQTTLDGKVIIAAFDLAKSPGWDDVSLRDIADAAGCSLADVMEHFDDKADILNVFFQHVDRAMLDAAGDVEREQTPRDAVFEVIMSRFDLMAPYKAGLRSIMDASPASLMPDPTLMRMTMKTQNKIMQAAGLSSAGGPALVRQLGLARVYDQVFRIWLHDDDAGMARTMAALDKRLRRGEQTLRTLDDVAKSSERMCAQATSFATRLMSSMRRTAEGRRSDDGGDTAADSGAPDASQPPTDRGADTSSQGDDPRPGGAPA